MFIVGGLVGAAAVAIGLPFGGPVEAGEDEVGDGVLAAAEERRALAGLPRDQRPPTHAAGGQASRDAGEGGEGALSAA